MKKIKHAFKTVYGNKKYILISLISALIIAIIFQLLIDIPTMIVNNGIIFTLVSIGLSYFLAILVGISVSFIWYQIDFRRKFDVKSGSGSFLSVFTGLITSGCPVCGTIITSALGIGSALATLPLKGLELKFFSIGLLSVMLFVSSKNITSKNCENCKV